MNIEFKLFFKVVFFILIISSIFIYFNLYRFVESNKPVIVVEDEIFSNANKDIKIAIHDDFDIVDYDVKLEYDGKQIPIKVKNISKDKRYLKLIISLKQNQFKKNELNAKNAILNITATDSSRINFFSGNTSTKKVNIFFDTVKPQISIISQSKTITKGGSALIIFKVNDKNIDDVYVDSNYNKKFKAIKFYQDNVYISMVAWPTYVKHSKFKLTAIDKADNIQTELLPIDNKTRFYKTSKIKLKEEFLHNVVSPLFDRLKPFNMPYEGDSEIDKFIFINENIREQNEKYIHNQTAKIIEDSYMELDFKAFRPLRRYALVADFGEKREFYYEDELKSISYHMGVDMANIKKSDIVANNQAIIIDVKNNGIYGNMPILYFGLGLYGIYGHCSVVEVKKGFSVQEGDIIGKTGKSGLVLGDHVHFGMLLQGIEVRPNEWMSQYWIDTNINNVIKEAKFILSHKQN